MSMFFELPKSGIFVFCLHLTLCSCKDLLGVKLLKVELSAIKLSTIELPASVEVIVVGDDGILY